MLDTLEPQPATGRIHDGEFRARFTELLHRSLEVFHHYSGLDALARQLTFLSFNAGFASFQAGESGVTVNVLTQFTRTMSQRLDVVHREILGLRAKTYQIGASVLASMQRVSVLDAARERVGAHVGEDGEGAEMCRTISLASSTQETEMFGFVQAMLAGVEKLELLGAEVGDAVRQIDSIAILMAIEAGVVGEHGEEFRWVADNIRTDVERLGSMVKAANKACRSAMARGEALVALRRAQQI